jgi:hypothetical protein
MERTASWMAVANAIETCTTAANESQYLSALNGIDLVQIYTAQSANLDTTLEHDTSVTVVDSLGQDPAKTIADQGQYNIDQTQGQTTVGQVQAQAEKQEESVQEQNSNLANIVGLITPLEEVYEQSNANVLQDYRG